MEKVVDRDFVGGRRRRIDGFDAFGDLLWRTEARELHDLHRRQPNAASHAGSIAPGAGRFADPPSAGSAPIRCAVLCFPKC